MFFVKSFPQDHIIYLHDGTCIIWCVNSDRSIIVECSKGKQTYLHSLSLNNQILRYIHYIAYKNICFLTLYGKGIAIFKRCTLLWRVGIMRKLMISLLFTFILLALGSMASLLTIRIVADIAS